MSPPLSRWLAEVALLDDLEEALVKRDDECSVEDVAGNFGDFRRYRSVANPMIRQASMH